MFNESSQIEPLSVIIAEHISVFLRLIHIYKTVLKIYYFFSGKECPETARSHKTRCDKFFRCVLLPSKNYVWVPTECEQGLIFEPSLKICVLPGEDWECNLNEENKTEIPDDGSNIYGVNNLDLNDENFNEELSSEKNKYVTLSENSDEKHNGNYEYIDDYGSSESKEDDDEFSGDGFIHIEEKEIPSQKLSTSDKQIATHLQRLTQLIDSLRNKEENITEQFDLVPDQLNSFLANHNIKSQFEQIDFTTDGKIPVPKDGVINAQHLNEILTKQAKLSTSTFKPPATIKPSARIILKNRKPMKNYRLPDGTYTSSQIVVNRPGGSVLFSIPSRDRNERPSEQVNKHPYMSDETLRTVLELSKQLIQSNHQNYLQPIVNPVYYTIPIPISSATSDEKKNNVKAYINNSPVTDPPLTIKDSFNTFYPAPQRNQNVPSNNISTTIFLDTSKDSEQNNYDSKKPPSFSEKPSNYVTKAPQQNDEPNRLQQNRYENQNQFYSQYYPPFQHNFPIQTFQNQEMPQQPPNSQQFSYPQTNNQHLNNDNINDAINFNSNFFPVNYNPNIPITGDGYYQNMNQNSNQQSYYQNQKMQYNQNSMIDETYDEGEEIDEEENDRTVMTTQLEPIMVVKKQKPVVQISYNGESIEDSDEDNEKKLVNLGGNFVNYEEYKKSIIPLLGGQRISQNNFDVVTCTSGMRQPNKAHCGKYYVCNTKTKNIISYSCPAYTAFNGETRICDARTYSLCNPQPLGNNQFSIKDNKNSQLEAVKAWEDSQKITGDSMNSQNFANLIRLETQKLLSESNSPIRTSKPAMVKKNARRRRYRCNEPGKIPDVTSNTNYYVCFKGSDNLMRRQKMVCTKGLVFCRKTMLCTLPKKCM